MKRLCINLNLKEIKAISLEAKKIRRCRSILIYQALHTYAKAHRYHTLKVPSKAKKARCAIARFKPYQ